MTQPGQPKGRRGTVGHAYSALNMRALMAGFGLVFMVVLAALLFRADQPVLAVLSAIFAAVALIDLIVVGRRLRRRHRAEPGRHYSLFE
ncbi:hypothetical protein K1W54_16050 [Micromonospora sp. CPCC 205371]|nr:hypothetical protein [Micromonospora sp. CPCC 205371]